MNEKPKPLGQKALSPDEIKRRDLIKEDCEEKLQSLTMSFLTQAKDDALGKDYFYNKFNNEWKTFASIKNKQQRLVVVHIDGFEKRVEYLIELAKNQLQDMNKQKEETQLSEHRGEEPQSPMQIVK
jgi:hypothetical protein